MKKPVAQPSTITVHVPMTFAVHGGRKAILSEITELPPQPRIDNALLKALAKAHRWRRQIENGDYGSITELAKVEGVNQSYACRLLRLTLLAPEIIANILSEGRSNGTMLGQLMKPLPFEWAKQLAVLKIHSD